MPSPSKTSYNIRALATKLIFDVLTEGLSLKQRLPFYKSQCKNREDASFLQALSFGVIRWYPRLYFIANQLLQKPIKAKEIELLYLICVGLYQFIDMHVPEHAVIAETVEAARVLNKSWATGLINAVLRSYQRKMQALNQILPDNEAAFYAHPAWLIHVIKSAWTNEWHAILTENNKLPPFSLRVNLRKVSLEQYLEKLETNGIQAIPIPYLQAGVQLQSAMDVHLLPGFNEGECSVQDGAAQFAAGLLDLKPDLHILDACAAPGGKTGQILEVAPDSCSVIALDNDPSRCQRIEENLKRLNLKATLKISDANQPNLWWDGVRFDRILLDAPCSATGVIRRHPDIKFLRQESDVHKLAQQQINLLNSLWPLLKSGGILVYATCSILPQENRDVIQRFLNETKDAYTLPIPMDCGIPQTFGLQLLPGQNDMDGFYYARIGKK